ncbi:acyl-[ACP]--phospholipid O-acyltransferase [Singulisphaera acidiphila]|uniref:acyl-[ACP]--phospholipid O-acyltransferase n=1 Tax=Singulisphaera acidiphila TaxID=466153 RepID=UPI0002D466C8|nr:acyl-[ACP]--phospholipid O-acyltransferase [Singulisphaera acidiphila]
MSWILRGAPNVGKEEPISVVGGEDRPSGHPLRGLLIAQFLGAFNDNAWKQIVSLLAISAAASVEAGQREAALAQMALLLPSMLFSLPAGTLADRVSKRSVILVMKVLELTLMIAGTLVLYRYPSLVRPAMAVLMLLGVQAALFSPAKYGILPEILPHEKLSSGNGFLELWSNLAIIAGIVGGGVLLGLVSGQPWLAGLVLTILSALGLVAAFSIPRVPAARAEGGIVATVRLGWSAIRADRILRLAISGQFLVWSLACLIPAPVLTYSKKVLELKDAYAGLPMAMVGIGIGIGSLLAGKISAAKVEYGLLPLGALGLTATTLAFGVMMPGVVGTLILMTLIGLFCGLLFVPLNALLQWRAPADGRGAVISLANVLVYGGMLIGSGLAWELADVGVTAQGTFLIASVALAIGSLWALWLMPDAFLRFLLLILAATLYRVKVIGREHVPLKGGALLTPNHVSFADGLFIIASIDRPVRFVVYAEYFRHPIAGFILRAMRAIPISGAGGPKQILQAFREAGRCLDEGQLVCVFPEGQITRTGLLQPFQRGMQRILKGRTTPIIPVHLDRATASLLSPVHSHTLPERIHLPVTVSFGTPLPADTPLPTLRQEIHDLDQEAWAHRKVDRRPLHHAFIRRARRHPIRLAFADALRPRVSGIGALAGTIALARALRPSWEGQPHVGILLPSSVAAALVNLAASLAGRVSVNLNFTAGKAGMDSVVKQAGLRTIVTSRAFLEKAKLELPSGVVPIWLEEIGTAITTKERLKSLALAWVAPVRTLERIAGAEHTPTVDDPATIIFSSGSTGEPKGVVLSHFNIDSNVEAITQIFRVQPGDRVLGILPLFHSFGYTSLWLAGNYGMGTVFHANPLDAATISALVEQYRATILLATPTFLQLYIRRCAPAQFGSLRLVIAGAEKLPEALATSFEDTFGIRPLEGYGMTECSPVVAISTLDYRAPGFFQPGSRRGFAGHPLPGVSVRVVDLATNEPVEPGCEGMLLVKGPNVMQGYLGRDDLTAAVMRDGWYVTGDIGLMDEDGFLKVTGRLSRFSKIGGEMVPHGRVEEALHQAIGADSQVFAVTAVGDEKKGEALAVLHTLDDRKVQETLEKVSAAGLPNLFIPRRDRFIKVEALPVLGTGKLDLRAIKRIAEEAFSGARPERGLEASQAPKEQIPADA